MGSQRKSYPVVSSTTLLLLLLYTAEARSTSSEPFRLVLDPIHKAAFIFIMTFGLFSALQTLAAIGKLGNMNKLLPSARSKRGENYSTGLLYPFLLFFATLNFLTYNILSAITVVFTFNEVKILVKPLSPAFVAGRSLVLQLLHWFIVCAMLALIFQRQKVGMEKASMRPYVYKLTLDALLLCGLLGIIITNTVLEATFQIHKIDQNWDAVHLGHAYIAFHIMLTLDVVFSAFWTWYKLKKESLPDLIMIGQVLKYISPLLVLQTAYEVIQHVILFSPLLYTGNRTLDALFLSRVVVVSTTNFVILWVAL